MLEDSINEGDKNQMSSNDELVEEYKEELTCLEETTFFESVVSVPG
jgi:hypothetical protein